MYSDNDKNNHNYYFGIISYITHISLVLSKKGYATGVTIMPSTLPILNLNNQVFLIAWIEQLYS